MQMNPHDAEHELRCPNCSYCLKGLSRDRCPECGEPFDRALLLAHRAIRERRLAWIRRYIGTLLILTSLFIDFFGVSSYNADWQIACFTTSLIIIVLALAYTYTSWIVRFAAVVGIAWGSYGLIWYILDPG